MASNKFLEQIRKGIEVGLLTSLFSFAYEVFKYITEIPSLFTGIANLIYFIIVLVIVPIISFLKTRSSILSYKYHFTVIFIGYLIYSFLMPMELIGLHYGIDNKYRERIVDYKIQQIQENRVKMERRLKAKIKSEIDFEELRNKELEKFEFNTLIKVPVQFLPVAVTFSLIFSYVLIVITKLFPPEN